MPVVEGVRRESRDRRHGPFAFSRSGRSFMCQARSVGQQDWFCSIAEAARNRSSFRPEGTTSRACLPMASGSRLKRRWKRGSHLDLRPIRCELGPAAHIRREQPLPDLVRGRPARDVSIRSRRRFRRVLATGRRRHGGAPHEARTGHVAYARVVVSRRRGAAVQRDEGFRLVALDALAPGSESDARSATSRVHRFRPTRRSHPTAAGWRTSSDKSAMG